MKKYIYCLMLSLLLPQMSTAQSKYITADTTEPMQHMANVARVNILHSGGKDVRIFSYTAGDPALNGLLLNLAVFNPNIYDWNVFSLKDVADYQILPSAKDGYLKLALSTDTMNSHGNISQKKSTLFINLANAEKNNGKIEIQEVMQK